MNKYQKQLEQALKASQVILQLRDTTLDKVDSVSNAITAFQSTYKKDRDSLSSLTDDANTVVEKYAKTVAELMVYEDDMKDAKKAKDKAKIKELDGKIKALNKTADKHHADHGKVMKDFKAAYARLNDAAAAVASSAGG